MAATPSRPQDDNPEDRDKPVDVPAAADHRPDRGADGSENAPTKSPDVHADHQNPDIKKPSPAIFQKRQRSQGMNHSER